MLRGVKIITKLVDVANLQDIRDFLIDVVEPDTEIILSNGNTPIAKLIPFNSTQSLPQDRIPDLYPTMWVSDNFDDLLPGEYWLKDQP